MIAKAVASATAAGVTAAGSGLTLPTRKPSVPPPRMPEDAAQDREEDRLHEELRRDVGAARPDGLPDADLLRPLGDGDEHDVHDADAADEKRQRDDADHRHVEHAGELAVERREVVLRVDGEVVRVVPRDLPPDPHELPDVLDRLAPSTRPRPAGSR